MTSNTRAVIRAVSNFAVAWLSFWLSLSLLFALKLNHAAIAGQLIVVRLAISNQSCFLHCWQEILQTLSASNTTNGLLALLQVAGWVIVCGFSAFFALIALFLVWVDVKFAGHKYNSEQFNTAGRSVKAGLIGVDVV